MTEVTLHWIWESGRQLDVKKTPYNLIKISNILHSFARAENRLLAEQSVTALIKMMNYRSRITIVKGLITNNLDPDLKVISGRLLYVPKITIPPGTTWQIPVLHHSWYRLNWTTAKHHILQRMLKSNSYISYTTWSQKNNTSGSYNNPFHWALGKTHSKLNRNFLRISKHVLGILAIWDDSASENREISEDVHNSE